MCLCVCIHVYIYICVQVPVGVHTEHHKLELFVSHLIGSQELNSGLLEKQNALNFWAICSPTAVFLIWKLIIQFGQYH